MTSIGLSQKVKANQLPTVLRKSTVVLKGPAGDGSGVVIGKKGEKYLLLSATHVVGSSNDETDVILPSGGFSTLKILRSFPDKDVSIGVFSSSEEIIPLPINTFLEYPAPNTAEYYAPELNLKSQFNTVTNKASVAGYSLPTNAVKVRLFRVIDAELTALIENNLNGYDLLYQASTVPGMSGGAVVGFRDCSNGKGFALGISPDALFPILVGIHGRSEDYHGQGRSGISLGIPLKGDIKEFIISNSNKFGVPIGEKNIRELVDEHYCL